MKNRDNRNGKTGAGQFEKEAGQNKGFGQKDASKSGGFNTQKTTKPSDSGKRPAIENEGRNGKNKQSDYSDYSEGSEE